MREDFEKKMLTPKGITVPRSDLGKTIRQRSVCGRLIYSFLSNSRRSFVATPQARANNADELSLPTSRDSNAGGSQSSTSESESSAEKPSKGPLLSPEGYGHIFTEGIQDVRLRPPPPFVPLKHFHPNPLWISSVDEEHSPQEDILRTAARRPIGKAYEPLGYQRVPRMNMEKSNVESFAKLVFLSEIFRGMFVFIENIFKEPFTINYPFEKGHLSPRFRGEHVLRRYPNGKKRIISYSSILFFFGSFSLFFKFRRGTLYCVQVV